MSQLQDKVIQKIRELGVEPAAVFFGVSKLLISQWERGSKPISLSAVEKVVAEEPSQKVTSNCDWEGKKVSVCLPWYSDVCPLTAIGLMSIYNKEKMGVLLNHGNSFIAHSRNLLASQFMRSGVEWSFWLDGDVIFPTGNAAWFNSVTHFNVPEKFSGMHTLNRLLSHQKSMIGGWYYQRMEGGKPTFAEANSSPALVAAGPRDEIRPTDWIATGCLLIHRSVFESITKQHPHLENKWFSHGEKELLDLGEDVLFSKRAKDAGHQPFVDLAIRCGHSGTKIY